MATRKITTKLTLDGEAEYKNKIKSLNAELALYRSELEKVTAQHASEANSAATLQAKISALQNQIDLLKTKYQEQNAMLTQAKQAEQNFAAQAVELRAKLDALKNSESASTEETAKLQKELAAAEANAEKAGSKVLNYQKQLNVTERDIAVLSTQQKELNGYLSECSEETGNCATSIDQYGNKVKSAAQSQGEANDKLKGSEQAVGALAAALSASGIRESFEKISSAIKDCIDTFAEFEAQMSKVQAISGASGDELATLTEKAKYMGATTAFTAAQAAEAYEYMAMAGWKTGDMLSGLDGIMNLAAASGEDLATTSDIITDALTAFGLKASDSAHFADVLAAASSNANTNVAMMGETFKYAAPVAGSLGYSVEDTALAIGLMANAGIKGTQAGTALRTMMTNLAKPSKDVAAYMDALGVSLTDSEGDVKSLATLLSDLRSRFSELSQAEQAEYAAGIAGKEAMSGLLAIVNASAADYRKLSSAIEGCNGAASKMSETMLDNMSGKMTLLRSAVDGLKIAIGDTLEPALMNLAEAGTDAFTWATEFVQENPWIVSAVAGLTAALGTLTVAVTGYAMATEVVLPLIHNFNEAIGNTPAGLTAVAITTLVAAVGAYVTTLPKAETATSALSDRVKDLGTNATDSAQKYGDLKAQLQDSTSNAQSLADQLAALQNKGELDTADLGQMAILVDQLNQAVPDLNLSFDETTGSITRMGSAAAVTADDIRQMIAAQAEQKRYGGLWQCAVYGFGGLRMLGGKLRISPNMPRAWKKLHYTLLWRGQKLSVTAAVDTVEIVNETGTSPVTVEVWGKEFSFSKDLRVAKE